MTQSSSSLFLHGLAGSGREWDALQTEVPAEAPDLRPYGTRDEYVDDVVGMIARRRVTLIGQSLGGHTAFLVAARHPELVRRLVVIEASPARDAGSPDRIRAILRKDPAPYGIELDPEEAARTLTEIAARDYWDQWKRIRCPVLVVRGDDGELHRCEGERMATEVDGLLVEIAGAGHDIHLERPRELAVAITKWERHLDGRRRP